MVIRFGFNPLGSDSAMTKRAGWVKKNRWVKVVIEDYHDGSGQVKRIMKKNGFLIRILYGESKLSTFIKAVYIGE